MFIKCNSKSGHNNRARYCFFVFYVEFMGSKIRSRCSDRNFYSTDKARGALKELANQVGYETFVVLMMLAAGILFLTAVGLLPIAAAGISIDELMQGAVKQREKALNFNLEEMTSCVMQVENVLLRRNYPIEILVELWTFFNVLQWDGGNNFMVRVKAKMARVYSRPSELFIRSTFYWSIYSNDGARNMFETRAGF